MRKSELRQLIRERKRPFTRQQLEEWSLAIVSQLIRHPRIIDAQTILLYHALPDEGAEHSQENGEETDEEIEEKVLNGHILSCIALSKITIFLENR